ncbi:MAG: ABC transporter ATP-binding protein [Selenomonadaceae bacterium]|nr:ABC transporter ATP-binding protein [Selenomonadaceae bacterium]
MIELKGICYAYDGNPVLRSINLSIGKGETVALYGANGSGKSTLLKLINGIIFPEVGEYWFENEKITPKLMRDHKYSKYFHQRIGFVWQNPDVQLFCGSVEEELAFGPEQMGLSESEVNQRVEDALKLLGIEKLRYRAPYYLSGGEKKKTAIASILTMNPTIWTLDEPLSALDEQTKTWLTGFLLELKKAGKTIVFSSHDSNLIKTLADRRFDMN